MSRLEDIRARQDAATSAGWCSFDEDTEYLLELAGAADGLAKMLRRGIEVADQIGTVPSSEGLQRAQRFIREAEAELAAYQEARRGDR